MSVKVYIDGQEGTTGLKIQERFEGRNDIERPWEAFIHHFVGEDP